MDSKVVQAHNMWGNQIEVGATYDFSEYTVGEDEIIRFAEQWDPQWFHIDSDAADEGPYGGLIASGVQTIAIFQRLSVVAAFRHWHVIAGRRLRDVRFLRPLRPGTTVSGHLRVTEVDNDKPGRTLVVVQGELIGDGKPLFTSISEVYVRSSIES
ncbi:MaoC/PaaZ C-terminal domain-containing protein [Rhodococcus sp. NPDC060086]|uniref:MaoC/PaaZ C-terminal domain-containing protein n=1 Tax=Rhodococcus sp. NPDC060086 TaxID=3347055 RepID=UPI003653BE74